VLGSVVISIGVGPGLGVVVGGVVRVGVSAWDGGASSSWGAIRECGPSGRARRVRVGHGLLPRVEFVWAVGVLVGGVIVIAFGLVRMCVGRGDIMMFGLVMCRVGIGGVGARGAVVCVECTIACGFVVVAGAAGRG
jgi:hypothetical protein